MSTIFDLHTLFVVCSALTVISGLCLALVQLTGRPYPGFNHCMAGALCQGLAYTSFAYAESLPLLWVNVGGNLAFALYSMLFSRGLRIFAGRRAPLWPMLLGLAYVAGVAFYFSAVHPSILWRVASISLCAMPFYVDCAWGLWRDEAFRYPIVRFWLTAAFSFLIFFALVRLGLMFALEPKRPHVWSPSALQVVYMTMDTALSLSVAIGIIVLHFERASASLKQHERLLTEDVVARMRVEAALRESELRYRVLVEMSPEAVIVHRDGKILYANPAAHRMFGAVSSGVLVERPMTELIHPSFHAVALRPQPDPAGGPMREVLIRRLDGAVLDAEIQSARIVYDGTAAIQVITHDISLRKRAEAVREALERKLQETQKLESLGVLAGGIAHDFNNILTGILGHASLARLGLPAGTPESGNLDAITEGARRAADLCRQMLDYSGKGMFVVRNCSLNSLVEETTDLLRVSISKRATLVFDLHPALPPIRADLTQIRQVLMNLVINASEALGEANGSITLRSGLQPGEKAGAGQVFLEVSDTGCGMSPETQKKIFEPFFTTKFSGRGLGLAAVLGIVRGHQGTLTLISEPGRGTTFRLLFPAAAGEVAPVEESTPLPWNGSGCVLVADDEEPVRLALGLMLQKLGFTPTMAADGEQACALFRKNPAQFSLVLLDLTMPRMDGKETFNELRRLRPELRVVLMSGFSRQESFPQFADQSLVAFLQKPFGFESLREVIQKILNPAPVP